MAFYYFNPNLEERSQVSTGTFGDLKFRFLFWYNQNNIQMSVFDQWDRKLITTRIQPGEFIWLRDPYYYVKLALLIPISTDPLEFIVYA